MFIFLKNKLHSKTRYTKLRPKKTFLNMISDSLTLTQNNKETMMFHHQLVIRDTFGSFKWHVSIFHCVFPTELRDLQTPA